VFDVGFWELAIIAAIALLVIGPERLPKAARTVGLWVGRARRMVTDVKSDIDREIRESDLAELKQAGEELKKAQSVVESSGTKLIQDSELGELKNAGEELKAAKNEVESAGANLLESSSADSAVELNKDPAIASTDPTKKNTSR